MPHAAPKRFSSTQAYRPLRAPETVEDKDACGIYAAVNKGARPSHETIANALVALEKMLHRAGNVDGEGDGCGVLIDIPRKIWAEEVRDRRPRLEARARPELRGRPPVHPAQGRPARRPRSRRAS